LRPDGTVEAESALMSEGVDAVPHDG